MEFPSVNYRCVQTFLASHYTETELKLQGIEDLVPKRVWKGGRRPGPTTTELGTKLDKDNKSHPESKWEQNNPDVQLSTSSEEAAVITCCQGLLSRLYLQTMSISLLECSIHSTSWRTHRIEAVEYGG